MKTFTWKHKKTQLLVNKQLGIISEENKHNFWLINNWVLLVKKTNTTFGNKQLGIISEENKPNFGNKQLGIISEENKHNFW